MAVQPPTEDPLKNHHRYQTVKYLSSGSYGFVVLARDRTSGSSVAIKFIERLKGKITKNVEREILNHSILIHPHVVRFEECFLTEKYLAIAMEYAAGGNMYSHVTANHGLQEEHGRFFYQQIILALDYCHKMSISNRDIKLENTLLDSTEPGRNPLIKLCDFGYSINESHSLPKTAVGTPGYTAPEVLMNRSRYDGKQADVWSSGVMLYAMLVCRYPFERPEDDDDPKGQHRIVQRIIKCDYEWPRDKPVSPELKDLMSKIFVADPAARISIAQIQKHPWFRKGLPPNLEVDTYNGHYVSLSKQAVDNADAIRRVVREALNEGSERRSISGDVDRMAERNSIDTEDSLENDYLSWY
ncbi:g4514 [Coccomyxa elongata]